MHGCAPVRACVRACVCVWMDGWMDGWMDVQMHVCVYEWMDVRCTNRRMDESANGWIVVSSDRQMYDVWMDSRPDSRTAN